MPQEPQFRRLVQSIIEEILKQGLCWETIGVFCLKWYTISQLTENKGASRYVSGLTAA